MSYETIIRAWKNEAYPNSLSAEELALLPVNPAGAIELTDADLAPIICSWRSKVMVEPLLYASKTSAAVPQSPAWYRALNLVERLASLSIGVSGSVAPATHAPAQEKLRQWQEQPPFPQGSYFSDRLAANQITEQELLYLCSSKVREVDISKIFSSTPRLQLW